MSADLIYVLKLLDDPEPTVKVALAEYFEQFEGDLSAQLAGEGISLSRSEREILSQYLLHGRRQNLVNSWCIPSRFQRVESEDWETFEFLLSLLSDYLHDGIILRPSLSDSLDQLADEVSLSMAHTSEDKLAHYLFESERFKGNRKHYFAKENSDVNWVIAHHMGSPISLVVLFMLLANRFNLNVLGCNYPGHFLAWIPSLDSPYLLDVYNKAKKLHPREVMANSPSISQNAQRALAEPCSLLVIILRILNNLQGSMEKEGLKEEVHFLESLKKTLHPSPAL